MSLAYVTRIVGGRVHGPFMAVAVGTEIVIMDCEPLRAFIREANRVGIYKVLEGRPPDVREALALVYEEFGDEIR